MQNVTAEFTIGRGQAIDTIFQIKAVPDISHLATKEELQETSDTINERIDGVVEAFDEDIETLNDRVDTMVQEVEGSELIGVLREGQTVTIASQTFVFEQGIASDTWDIVHNLNKRPSINLVDSSGREFEAVKDYISDNEVIIHLDAATSGYAYLN